MNHARSVKRKGAGKPEAFREVLRQSREEQKAESRRQFTP
jgi:hypothetical protein